MQDLPLLGRCTDAEANEGLLFLSLEGTAFCNIACIQSYLTVYNTWTVAHQPPLSVQYARQEYWHGLPFYPLGDLPNTGR